MFIFKLGEYGMSIYPYKFQGLWVFDDPAVGLHQEPFISGIDKMIDLLVA